MSSSGKCVIERRVDRTIRDTHILAGIDIDAVPIRVDLDVVDGEIVDAGGQDREVAAVQNSDVANDNVAAKLQSDRLVAPAGFNGVAGLG
jgi:hypothetical protein